MDVDIEPMGKALVPTDIAIKLPSGCYGRIAPRSSLAWENFIMVGAGFIDPDYSGNVLIVLFNFSREKFMVRKGYRVAQLICEKVIFPPLVEVEAFEETGRNTAGLGSTGK